MENGFKKKKNSSVLYFLPCGYLETVKSDMYGKRICSRLTAAMDLWLSALWKSFALLRIISKDPWIMQWTGSILFQNWGYLTLHQNDTWAECSLSPPIGCRGNFSLINVRFFIWMEKCYSRPFMRLKFSVSWWKLNKAILSPFNVLYPRLTPTLY